MTQATPTILEKTFSILDLTDNCKIEVDVVELRQRFERNGVIIAPDFLTEAELAPLRRELSDYYAPLAPNASKLHNSAAGNTEDTGCDVIPWDPVAQGNAEFRTLAAHRELAEITTAVLGENFTAPGSLVMFSVGGGRGQAWHQDCPSGADQGFNLNRLFYTEDVTREDGALVFVPGSHRLGRIPPGEAQTPIDGEKMLTPRAGTLVLLNGHVYHRVTPNLNRKPRVSVNFRAFPAGVSKDVTCIGVYRNGTVNFCDKPKQHDGIPAGMNR